MRCATRTLAFAARAAGLAILAALAQPASACDVTSQVDTSCRPANVSPAKPINPARDDGTPPARRSGGELSSLLDEVAAPRGVTPADGYEPDDRAAAHRRHLRHRRHAE